DGLRSMNEVNIFREFWKFPIISIIIDEEIRIKRLLERGREDDSIKIDDIKERDEREIRFGLKEVIENSDYKINNNSTITDLQEKTRKIIFSIIKELLHYIHNILRKRLMAQLQRNFGLILVQKRDKKITTSEELAEEEADRYLYEWNPKFLEKKYRVPHYREKLEKEIAKTWMRMPPS
ncbi:unnamed protein product, partial [marine sediment metagenome]